MALYPQSQQDLISTDKPNKTISLQARLWGASRVYHILLVIALVLSWLVTPLTTSANILKPLPLASYNKVEPIEKQVQPSAGGTISFESSSYNVNEGVGTAVFTLTRSGNTVGAVSASILPTDITTISKTDYILPGREDTTFLSNETGANSIVRAIAIQPNDNKIIVGGDFNRFDSISRTGIARLNPDRTLDTSFPISETGANKALIYSIAIQPNDGKILAAGVFTSYYGVAIQGLVRLLPDGSLDTSFLPTNGGFDGSIRVVLLQPDGKILVGGDFDSYNGITSRKIARLNADGSLDTSFQATGAGANNDVTALALQPNDNKIIASGVFTQYNGVTRGRIARLNTDGSLDTSFQTSGQGANNYIATTAIHPISGKIFIGGSFSSYDGSSQKSLVRLNPNGTIDTSFTASDFYNGDSNTIYDIAVVGPNSNKILVGGSLSTRNGIPSRKLIRLNQDGSLDTSFSYSGEYVLTIVEQPNDGKILVGTAQLNIVVTPALNLGIKRLIIDSLVASWADGEGGSKTFKLPIVDDGLVEGNETFKLGIAELTGGAVRGAAHQATVTLIDNDIILSSVTYKVNENVGSALITLTRGSGTNGAVSVTLGITDVTTTATSDYTLPSSLVVNFAAGESGSKVFELPIVNDSSYEGLLYETLQIGIVGVQGNGAAIGTPSQAVLSIVDDDPPQYGSISFESNAYNVNEETGTAFVTLTRTGGSDEAVIATVALTDVTATAIADYSLPAVSGSLDPSFEISGTNVNGTIRATAVQPSDGKILVGGEFTTFNGVARRGIARLNHDGSLDTSFLATGSGVNNGVFGIKVQANDGKIILIGSFSTYNGVNVGSIIRLNPDGSLDTSFLNDGYRVSFGSIYVTKIQPNDGKIVLFSVSSTRGLQNTYGSVVRLNSDGSLDNTFPNSQTNPLGFYNGVMPSLEIQPNDGKILVGGSFNSFNGVSRNRVARLNPDGSLDSSFVPTNTVNNATSLALQPNDGKILVAGTSTVCNTLYCSKIFRLNPDGSVDHSFVTTNTETNNLINNITIQPSDGKILVSGVFTSFNGVAHNRIVRLNPDGSLDPSFVTTDGGANNSITAITLQANEGKILISGVFTSYDGFARNKIARLNLGNLSTSAYWRAGEGGSKVISIPIVDDNLVEGQEDLMLSISNLSFGATIGANAQANLTIIDNDFVTTSLALTATPNPSSFGQEVILTATLNTITATGTVTFSEGAIVLGTTNLTNGLATFSINSLNVGTHLISATYGGDATYASSTSNVITQVVTQIGTSLTLNRVPSPTPFGQTIVFTATLNAITATGMVTLTDGTIVLGIANLASGMATFNISSLTIGSHLISAIYGGDTTYIGSTSNQVTQVVTQLSSSLTLIGSPSTSSFGQTLFFTATLNASTATGTVTFSEGANILGTANLVNGLATFSINRLNAGSHLISAIYEGDTTYVSSTSNTITQIVTQLSTSLALTANANPSGLGQTAIFTATITPTMDNGTLTFYEGNTLLGTANLTNGVATLTTTSLGLGTHSIIATYDGNVNFEASTSNTVSHEVISSGKCTGRCPH